MKTKSIMQLRLDRIDSIKEGTEKNKKYKSFEFLSVYEEMFSASFEPEKTHVKVLFQDFGNIRERLSTLHNKRKFSKLYDISPLSKDIPHNIVYEDDLRGVSAFSRFLRSFGSSALVLEPSSLQDLMINSNQLILNNYEVTMNENK
jgi:predicted DNA-binding transcriptional regulator YafY